MVGCWREAAGGFGAVLGTVEMLRVALGQDGITWAEAGEDVVLWAAVSVVWAVVTSLSLRRRARTVGVAFTPDVLADRQTRQLRALRPSVGWSDRMRAELKASDRVAVTAEKGREEIWFRWRPGRHGHTVWGSITFDEPSGTVLLDLREGEAYTGISGVRRGCHSSRCVNWPRGWGWWRPKRADRPARICGRTGEWACCAGDLGVELGVCASRRPRCPGAGTPGTEGWGAEM